MSRPNIDYRFTKNITFWRYYVDTCVSNGIGSINRMYFGQGRLLLKRSFMAQTDLGN